MHSSILISLPIFLLLLLIIGGATAATFIIQNNCPYTVWPAATPGGGRQLDTGETWTIDVTPGTITGRIWARTGCSFDEDGRGGCLTGDCDGVLECSLPGKGQPNTLIQYALDQENDLDNYDITLMEGFNVPLEIRPISGCNTRPIRCATDITDQCPPELQAPGGCHNPCFVFKTEQYCCVARPQLCQPTEFSMFFKERCPDAYSYPKDQHTLFTCPGGTNYMVVFCPIQQQPLISSP